MTIAAKVGKLLPNKLYSILQPKYQFFMAKAQLRSRGGGYSFNNELGGWVLRLPMPKNGNMLVLVRTLREFKRAVKFGINKKDLVWKWINWIKPNSVLYDIGSANGLEGFSAAHLKNSYVYFIEPYTPSIETILKTIAIKNNDDKSLSNVTKSKKIRPPSFEVIHAACTAEEDYKKLRMHAMPVAGQTRNTYGSRHSYEEGGGRNRKVSFLSQWVKGITIDSLYQNYNMKAPDYIKIDVDGHETLVIEGAKNTIKSGVVKSWAIELNGNDRITKISKILLDNNYVIADDYDHYPNYSPPTIDRIFIKKEYLKNWKEFNF